MCEADTKARLANLVASTHTLERTVNETLHAIAAVENAWKVAGVCLGTHFFEKHHQVYLHRAQDHAKNAVAMLKIYKERLEDLRGAPGVHSLEQDADAHRFYHPNTGAK